MPGVKEVYYDEVPSLLELWELIDEGQRFTIKFNDSEQEEVLDDGY